MRHQVTGSVTISTDGIAEAVVDALRPLLADLTARCGDSSLTLTIPLTTEQVRNILTTAVGSLQALSRVPDSDFQIASQLTTALLAAGYTLTPVRPSHAGTNPNMPALLPRHAGDPGGSPFFRNDGH